MDDLGHYNTNEEIKNLIISEIQKRGGTVRVAAVNSQCANEAQLDQVLFDMIQKGEVQSDGNFIFIKP